MPAPKRGQAAPKLRGQAEAFAERLTKLLNGTMTAGADVTVVMMDGSAIIALGRAETAGTALRRSLVPCSTAAEQEEREKAALWLRASYSVEMDAEDEHMQVATSVFGLCVNPQTGLCPIRVEYDRRKTSRQPAHVQVHGDSGALGYAFAMAGGVPKALHKLHIPVGNRRFRPSLEDFIEFLAQEGLLVDLRPEWRNAIEVGRGDWEARQTRATVRRAPGVAADQLRSMGYVVTDPGS